MGMNSGYRNLMDWHRDLDVCGLPGGYFGLVCGPRTGVKWVLLFVEQVVKMVHGNVEIVTSKTMLAPDFALGLLAERGALVFERVEELIEYGRLFYSSMPSTLRRARG